MTTILFVTLFLDLIRGPQRIELKVVGPVDRVQLEVDGRRVVTLAQPPWVATVDLGASLVPHRLVARALDRNGGELAVAQQNVNVPRPFSEAKLVLDRDEAGSPTDVQVIWQSRESDQPKSVTARLDDAPLPLTDRLRAHLPHLDLSRPHLVSVHTRSPSGSAAESVIAFGGGLEGAATSELTSILVRFHGPATLGPADVGKALSIANASPAVIAVEKLPADVIIVRNPVSFQAAMRLDPQALSRRPSRALAALAPETSPDHREPTAHFVWPAAKAGHTAIPVHLFPWSPQFPFTSAADLQRIVAHVGAAASSHLRLADAVAVGGAEVAGSHRPGAVILILAPREVDESDLNGSEARHYLQTIGVPLYVWSLTPGTGADAWGDVVDVSTPERFRAAYDTLQKELESQRVVWLNGAHFPDDVEGTGSDIEVIAKR